MTGNSRDAPGRWAYLPFRTDLLVYAQLTPPPLILAYLLFSVIFGRSAVETFWPEFVVVAVLMLPADILLVLPAFSAWGIGSLREGIAVVRRRPFAHHWRPAVSPWAAFSPGRKTYIPGFGTRYAIKIAATEAVPWDSKLALTKTQAEIIAAQLGKRLDDLWTVRGDLRKLE